MIAFNKSFSKVVLVVLIIAVVCVVNSKSSNDADGLLIGNSAQLIEKFFLSEQKYLSKNQFTD